MSNASQAMPDDLEPVFGRSVSSVRRFSIFKWLVAATLLALLLIVGLNRGPEDGLDSGGPLAGGTAAGGSTGPGTATGAPAGLDTLAIDSRGNELFAIQRAANGQLQVRGHLPDATTRDVWMNAIRRGAQQMPVADQLQVGEGASESAQWYSLWSSHLLPLTATLRERNLAGLAIEGHRVVVRGQVAHEQERLDVVRLLQGQIPPGFQLDSRLLLAQGETTTAAVGATTPATSGTAGSAAAGGSGTGGSAGAAGAEPGQLSGLTGSGLVAPAGSAGSAGSTGLAGAAPSARTGQAAGSGVRSGPDVAAVQPGLPGTPLIGSASQGEALARPPAAARGGAPVKCPRTLSTLTTSVHFDTDAAVLSDTDRQRLERLGACLGNSRLRIVGRTDPRHTESYNQTLSERRAQAVADAIRSGGADAARLNVVGAGVARQSGNRQNAASLRQSRRVDIQLR